MSNDKNNTYLWLGSLLAPLAVLTLIWFPEIDHYYVPGGPISDTVIQKMKVSPQQEVLEEVAKLTLLDPRIKGVDVRDQAQQVLSGELLLPGIKAETITLPFSAADLDNGPLSWQLSFAGLSAVKLLLDAFEQTAHEPYFNLAKQMVIAWSEYESNAWMPKGFLWNDHAVAARLPVLSQFWKIYRVRPDFDQKVARLILQFVLRNAQFLAKPSHFTFATNHGVMQNLALWHAVVAFPELPGVEKFRRIAFERMLAQMKFYINEEGVVLEHSAGYHAHGVYFLGSALRYLELLKESLPTEWRSKYRRAKTFYGELTRPDGSIPVFGDTPRDHNAHDTKITQVSNDQVLPLQEAQQSLRPQRIFTVNPLAGYTILWRGLDRWNESVGASQTTMVWSYFPGLGHKLADEMSVLLWADGQDWWSNIGYWPYGLNGRQQAESWLGSNAPHLLGESFKKNRRTQLRFFGHNNMMTLIDLQRENNEGVQFQRQLLHVDKNLWLVLDSAQDPQNRINERLWTTLPGVKIREDSEFNGYWLTPNTGSSRLQVALQGSDGVIVERLSGSMEPFAGWMVMAQRKISETGALLVRQPSNNSWSLAIWKLVNEIDETELKAQPRMTDWRDAENWQLNIPLSSGAVVLQRLGDTVKLLDQSTSRNNHRLVLSPGPDVEQEFQLIQSEFNHLAKQYPPFRDLIHYRWKVTYGVIVLLLIQETFLWRIGSRRIKMSLRFASVFAWLMIGAWLKYVYFAS